MKDEEITDRLPNGDKHAYKELFTRYYSLLCEYASLYVRDDEAEELVGELMIHLWETREHLFIVTSLKAYLFTAVKHRCLNAIRRNLYHAKAQEHLRDILKEQLEEPNDYEFEELAREIEKAIEALPESYRETFKMSRFGEESNKKLAERLGVSVKTVEYRITQSLKILRVKLKDYLPLIYWLSVIGYYSL